MHRGHGGPGVVQRRRYRPSGSFRAATTQAERDWARQLRGETLGDLLVAAKDVVSLVAGHPERLETRALVDVHEEQQRQAGLQVDLAPYWIV